jgi:acyl-CoA thioesterase-1
MLVFKRIRRYSAAAAICLAAMIAGAAAEPVRIVGLGDSLMAGYQLAPGESFPEKLETALKERGHDVLIVNAGVSGDTTSGGLSRLDWSVPDGTDLVILELGANDMLRGIRADVTEKNLAAMIERLKARGIGVVLAGMVAAPNLGAGYAGEFNPIFPRLAETFGLSFYPFFLDGVAAQSRLLLADGMHPNSQGVDVMVERFVPLMEEVLTSHAAAGG